MSVDEISVDELQRLVDAGGDGIVLVDVREDHEWNEAHVESAIHIPLAGVPDRLDEFCGNPTYVICRSGGRSGQACEFLAANGIAAVNVAGGLLAWTAAGFDVARGA